MSAWPSATTAPSTRSPARRADTSSPRSRSSPRSTNFSPSAATWPASTEASTRSSRSTTTAICSRAIRARYGDRIELYAFTIAEFLYLADHASLSYAETAERLKQAGVRWITGGGSEILTEDFRRRHSKFKYTVAQFFAAQAAIVDAGLRTTATMVIGFDETIEERIEHLDRTRRFQDETGAQESFLCWNFKPWSTPLGDQLDNIEITPAEYLRHLALSRIYLDNIPRIRTSVLTQNERALEGLLYGADDFDLPIEDEVTQKAGATIDLNFDRILDVARSLGFEPRYRHVELDRAAKAI